MLVPPVQVPFVPFLPPIPSPTLELPSLDDLPIDWVNPQPFGYPLEFFKWAWGGENNEVRPSGWFNFEDILDEENIHKPDVQDSYTFPPEEDDPSSDFEWPGFGSWDRPSDPPDSRDDSVDIPLLTPDVPYVPEEEEDEDTDDDVDPEGNDIVEDEPSQEEGNQSRGFASWASPYSILFGVQNYRRFTGYYDPCKALAERSHEKVYQVTTRSSIRAQQKAIRITYYNRSKCKEK